MIAGPTACGKTELVHALSTHEDVILGADSRQIFRHLDIGTAKPSPEERSGRDYHLIDCVDPDQTFTAYDYLREALRVLDASRGKKIFIAGGTPFYLDAFLHGFFEQTPLAREVRENAEKLFREGGLSALQEKVKALDPDYYAVVDRQNPRRLLRAIEAMETTGETFSALRQKRAGPDLEILTLIVFRNRKNLLERIEARVDAMMSAGFPGEVRGLLARGYDPCLSSMTGIGYRELISHIQGKISLEEATLLTKQKTRQFARRQLTWFRKIKNALFLDLNEEGVPTDDPLDEWFYRMPILPELEGKEILEVLENAGPFRMEKDTGVTGRLGTLVSDFFNDAPVSREKF
ncbi:MAG: tRNA (adenosine(37)-N6)-dimethylallyltransferase MiaA [Spirochaetia bacterium]|nr:tRNA (adenosine(37)-N6)-dimethylallyltransferase MiaA [Spirochaetia bacterium]